MKDRIFISGATSGVGREVCIGLSESFNLVLHSTSGVKLDELLPFLDADCDCDFFVSDFSDPGQLESDFVEFLKGFSKPINSFVHFAGLFKMIPFRRINISHIDEMFRVNYYSAILITKYLSSKRLNDDFNSVVLVSSHISQYGVKATSLYSSTKAALDSLARNLAVEMAPTRVNSIRPGGMRTSSTEDVFADEQLIDRIKGLYPLGLGTGEYLTGIVRFLLSPDSSWITGQSITVDGGRSIFLNS